MINPRELSLSKAFYKKNMSHYEINGSILANWNRCQFCICNVFSIDSFVDKYENKSIKEIFHEIENNSEYIFFYYDKALDINRRVTVNAENQTVDKILDQVFESTNNTYVIEDRQIFISSKVPVVKMEQPQQQLKKIYWNSFLMI
jgi:hypothetical protein